MSDAFNPFVATSTYRRDLYRDPTAKTKETVGWVELRPLSAGEMAQLQELKLSDGGGGSMAVGRIRFHQVEAALVAWSFEAPPTSETLQRLKPLVFEQIYRHVDVGGGESEEESAESAAPFAGSPSPEPAGVVS